MTEAGPKLASIGVDLDEIPCYTAIHGLPEAAERVRHAVYDRALPRWLDFFDQHGIRGTFFVVGADTGRPENVARLREAAARGHEIANHSHRHRYDLTRLARARMAEEIDEATAMLGEVVGTPPTGFRSPGYTTNEALLEHLAERGYLYDSSVFPCPAYYLAKAAAMVGIRLRGRASRSILDHPRVLLAPADPYRIGARYHRRGEGLLELPIAVTRRLRLPFIGTFVVLGSDGVARGLARGAAGRPLVNFEAHGIDLADAELDGLEGLRAHQPDLRVPLARKLDRLGAAVGELRARGHRFVRVDEAARVLGG